MPENTSLSFLLATNKAKRAGEPLGLVAEGPQLEDLAQALEVSIVKSLAFDGRFSKYRKNGLKVAGHLTALVEQDCVVSLEPVEQAIEATVERVFLPVEEIERENERIDEGELVIDPDDELDIDELDNGIVNLWDVLLEEVNLHIDPFPRHPDHQDETSLSKEVSAVEVAKEVTHRPFSDLKALISEKKTGQR